MPALTLYRVQDSTLLLNESEEKQYTLRIHDLPIEDKPRERLLSGGPEILSIQELLSVVLNVGTKKEGVRAMTERIFKEYGEKSLMGRRDAKRLAEDLSIPLTKAVQIIACLELGRRLYARNENGAQVVRTARDVYEYLKDMRDLPKEHLRGLYLNTHYKVIHDETISIGTLDTNLIHPREVFKPALEYSAAAVILAHNHPSGETAASSADITITKQISDAGKLLGITLIDHVIITRDSFLSVPCEYVS